MEKREEENKESMNISEVFHAWRFPEYPRYSRGVKWYFFAGLAFALLLGYAIWNKNFFFVVIIILFAAISFLVQRFPRDLECKIAREGIFIGKKLYPYGEIDKFWIIYDPPEVKNLYLHAKSIMMPRVIVPLEDQNPLEIRETLSKYLQEDIEQEGEPPLDSWTRILKL